jgi:hypothetical protein
MREVSDAQLPKLQYLEPGRQAGLLALPDGVAEASGEKETHSSPVRRSTTLSLDGYGFLYRHAHGHDVLREWI